MKQQERGTMTLKMMIRIMTLDFPPAQDATKGMKFHRNTSTNRETNGYTSGMLTCQNAKAGNHNYHRSRKGIQRSMQQYRTAHDREFGYIPLYGLVCLVFS